MSLRFRELRKVSGITQYELARIGPVGRTRLSLAENGHIRLTPKEERAVENALLRVIERRAAQLGAVASRRERR